MSRALSEGMCFFFGLGFGVYVVGEWWGFSVQVGCWDDACRVGRNGHVVCGRPHHLFSGIASFILDFFGTCIRCGILVVT